jgi:hypothetical protein
MKKIEVDPNELEPLKDIIKTTSGTWTGLISLSNCDSEKKFREQEVPIKDIPHPHTPTIDFCNDQKFTTEDKVETRLILRSWYKEVGAKQLTNSMIYLPETLMRWHTNSDNPGVRRYYTFTRGDAWFAWVDEEGNVKYDKDNAGWTVREFKAPIWHSIYTSQLRFSFGLLMDV